MFAWIQFLIALPIENSNIAVLPISTKNCALNTPDTVWETNRQQQKNELIVRIGCVVIDVVGIVDLRVEIDIISAVAMVVIANKITMTMIIIDMAEEIDDIDTIIGDEHRPSQATEATGLFSLQKYKSIFEARNPPISKSNNLFMGALL